jgi:Acyl dehydratase
MVEAFCGLSGDTNMLHCDRSYAMERGYQDRVVYGMLVASLYSTLVGVYLPGELCLLNKVDVSFRKPVYPGDELTVSGEVVSVHQVLRVATIKAKIVNQDSVKVSNATIQVSVREN